jgi:hypothetical protein
MSCIEAWLCYQLTLNNLKDANGRGWEVKVEFYQRMLAADSINLKKLGCDRKTNKL